MKEEFHRFESKGQIVKIGKEDQKILIKGVPEKENEIKGVKEILKTILKGNFHGKK